MNNVLTNAEAIKECRAAARANGLTFKAYENLRINGKTAYRYTDRKTGETVRGNLTLGLAYDIACSGELSK